MEKINPETIKKLSTLAGIGLGAYFIYKISKGSSVESAVKETINKPIEIIKKTADEIVGISKKVVKKGSKQLKKIEKVQVKKMKIKPKKSSKKKSTKHKGHKTKRGLSQDQKRVSKESHEKAYQKKKTKKSTRTYMNSSNWKLTQDKSDGTMVYENDKNYLIGIIEPRKENSKWRVGDQWRAGFGKEKNQFFSGKREAIKHLMGRMKAFPD